MLNSRGDRLDALLAGYTLWRRIEGYWIRYVGLLFTACSHVARCLVDHAEAVALVYVVVGVGLTLTRMA